MDINNVNLWAVVAAALSYFILGALWYGWLFEKKWMAANGFTKNQVEHFSKGKRFGLSFLFALVMAFNLAMFIGAQATVAFGVMAGFLAGFGWVALSIAITGFFENRNWTYILINGGYQALAFTLMGLILGSWH